MPKKRRHLGEILYRSGLVKKEALVKAIKKSKADNKRLGETLIDMDLISEEDLSRKIAEQFGLEYIDLDEQEIPQSARKLIPEELMRKHLILPLEMDNGRLKLIISDPLDLDTLDLLRFRLNAELDCCYANPSKIKSYIFQKMDEVRSSIDATAAELAAAGHAIEDEIRRAEAEDDEDEGPIIRLVNLIIDEACRMRASDIHIEPMTDRVRLRYRIDGVCIFPG
jgi:type IV pilus assembly protein PilB